MSLDVAELLISSRFLRIGGKSIALVDLPRVVVLLLREVELLILELAHIVPLVPGPPGFAGSAIAA